MRRGYRRVRGDFAPYLADLDLAPQPIGVEREALLAALRGYFSHRGFDANWDAIKRLPDDMLVVTLAMVCPFEPAGEAGAAGGAAAMRSAPRPCWRCCRWARWRRTRRAAAA